MVGGWDNVRFGSKADICAAKSDVRFTLDSDRKSGHPQTAISALPPESGRVRRKPSCLLWPEADMSRQD
jgi:hypothetical protein